MALRAVIRGSTRKARCARSSAGFAAGGRWQGRRRRCSSARSTSPGRRMSTDFTHAEDLGVTIGGAPFEHLLCHCVLTYSNWEWATICHSESMLALRVGIQAALFRLGRVPREHWTDHSSAATHRPGKDAEGQSREFNAEYLEVMEHFGMRPAHDPGRLRRMRTGMWSRCMAR